MKMVSWETHFKPYASYNKLNANVGYRVMFAFSRQTTTAKVKIAADRNSA